MYSPSKQERPARTRQQALGFGRRNLRKLVIIDTNIARAVVEGEREVDRWEELGPLRMWLHVAFFQTTILEVLRQLAHRDISWDDWERERARLFHVVDATAPVFTPRDDPNSRFPENERTELRGMLAAGYRHVLCAQSYEQAFGETLVFGGRRKQISVDGLVRIIEDSSENYFALIERPRQMMSEKPRRERTKVLAELADGIEPQRSAWRTVVAGKVRDPRYRPRSKPTDDMDARFAVAASLPAYLITHDAGLLRARDYPDASSECARIMRLDAFLDGWKARSLPKIDSYVDAEIDPYFDPRS